VPTACITECLPDALIPGQPSTFRGASRSRHTQKAGVSAYFRGANWSQTSGMQNYVVGGATLPPQSSFRFRVYDSNRKEIESAAINVGADPRLWLTEEARRWESDGWEVRRPVGMGFVGFHARRHDERVSAVVTSNARASS
jgi:hypothetical protein